jgi:SAM-dependent methyltransferase
VYARYTNDHSGCYILTRRQLKACIRSGGFALVPHEGRYDMLCAAATDPYTRCGFRKTICISRLEDFSLHHLPDIYLGRIGVETPEIDAQVRRLLELAKTPTPERPLIKPETRLDTTRFDKKYFEPYRGETVELFPQRLGRILSVGCERGLTEGQLVAAGHEVVGIPLDSVIAVSAAMRGVKMVPGGFDEALDRLAEDRFDHLLFNNVLSFVPDPPALLDRFMRLLKPDGTVVISFDNARYIGELKRAARRSGWWRALRGPGGFDTVGFHPADPKAVRRWLRAAGLSPSRVNLAMLDRHGRLSNGTFGLIDDVLAHSGAIVALRSDRPVSNHPPAASERRVVGVPGRESGPHRA